MKLPKVKWKECQPLFPYKELIWKSISLYQQIVVVHWKTQFAIAYKEKGSNELIVTGKKIGGVVIANGDRVQRTPLTFVSDNQFSNVQKKKTRSRLEVERAGNFSARELSWAFQILNLASWAESSFFRFWIWRAELSWAFSDFEFGELSWAELARAKRAKKRAQTEAQIIDMASWMSWIL